MRKNKEQLQQEVAEIRRFVDGDSRDVAMKPVLKTGKSIIHCNKGDQPHEWKDLLTGCRQNVKKQIDCSNKR